MLPLIIVNPHSCGGRTGRQLPELARHFEQQLGRYEIVATAAPAEATEVAAQAARQGREIVLAVGGDGTIHEVVNGLMRAREQGAEGTRLGIISRGTGGDFRRSLGLSNELSAQLEVIRAGQYRKIDVARFQYAQADGTVASAYFVNILTVGFGGLADRYVASTSRRWGRKAVYLSSVLRALAQSEVGVLRCTLSTAGHRQVCHLWTRALALCNGQYFGCGMHVAPMAQLDDGLLHLVSLGAEPPARFAFSSLSVYRGAHVNRPQVRVSSAERIDIELLNRRVRERFLLDVDGEPFGYPPVSIQLQHRALEVFVAPQPPEQRAQ